MSSWLCSIYVGNKICWALPVYLIKKEDNVLELRESRFFQNCGTFNTNQNKKYHNFERNEIRAIVFSKWADFIEDIPCGSSMMDNPVTHQEPRIFFINKDSWKKRSGIPTGSRICNSIGNKQSKERLNLIEEAMNFQAWSNLPKQSLLARTTDTRWLEPKFSKTQNHTPNPSRKSYEMYENCNFLQKNALAMQNHGLWIHMDTNFSSELPKTPKNTSQILWLNCPISQNIWDI